MELYGVPSGILYGQNERVDELNERIQSRQFSDKPLNPNFSSRPLMSKYAHFPVLDRRHTSNEPIVDYGRFHVSTNFNPGTKAGPAHAYLSGIDVESEIRNQHHKIQKNNSNQVYVPHSNSELYNVRVPYVQSENPHPRLFVQEQLKTFRGNNVHPSIGKDVFNNHTRTQLRGL
jgi:hypothetical protein